MLRTFAGLLVLAAFVFGQETKRPKITGVAHVAYYVKDVDKSRTFYKDFLGYDEPFLLKNADGSLSLTFIKINDRQYIELFPEREPNSDRLNHISIETDDAEAMRRYLATRGVKVPDKAGKGRIGNANFNVKDPDGHTVEIVQYMPDGWSKRDAGKFMPSTRISDRMMHTGIIVNELTPAMQFYTGILGFEDIWRGSRDGKVLNWVNVKPAETIDYVELMLHDPVPEPTKRGSAHHICLVVPDLDKAAAILKERAAKTGYDKPMEIRTGINRKRQLNLFDPDGTRVELMEPHTIDGKPTPSATAPPPK
ncbi:MAG TPA: VOC family protein [Bryobacteraceae bacterium]|nr:VOC family protein [Bryobacteraceae bacterium]